MKIRVTQERVTTVEKSWRKQEEKERKCDNKQRASLPVFRAFSSASFHSRSSLLFFSVALLLSKKQVSSSRESRSFTFFVSFLRPQIHASLQSQISLLPEIETSLDDLWKRRKNRWQFTLHFPFAPRTIIRAKSNSRIHGESSRN